MSWLIARALNQRGLLPHLGAASPLSTEDAPRVVVIVPARDEEANIGPCLQSLLLQDYPASRLRVLVVDDHSADATLAIVSGFAARDARLAVSQSPPLPPRWIGKSHACWIGARTAAPEAEWLCFIDADVRSKPALLSSAMRAARTALLGSGAAFGLHIAATFYFRIPFWYGLLFPLGYTAGALMAFDSVRRRLSGRVSWKGRIYS